ncbi:MAG: zinc dependent phospholipase C family protein [Clostridia bacterium]|nr:zinc dependent phospholipase C family protein [Clostridia bacterium]
MPNFFTHCLCGEKTLELLEDEKLRQVILSHRNVFTLGAQGPDILFYYRIWPWTDSMDVDKFGEALHSEKISDFFRCALEYTDSISPDEKLILTTYLMGYLCHYSLDSTAHPFVYYFCGFQRSGENASNKYTYYHRLFETLVDILMLKREKNLGPYHFKPHSMIALSKLQYEAIGKMYSHILGSVYGANISTRQVVTAIKDMQGIYRTLWDKYGLKKPFFSLIERIINDKGAFTSTIYPHEADDRLDLLNLSHSEWTLPWDNTSAKNSSFTEMFDGCAIETARLWQAAFSFLEHASSIEAAVSVIGNRSFSTGLDCSLRLEFKYFDCIFERYGKYF